MQSGTDTLWCTGDERDQLGPFVIPGSRTCVSEALICAILTPTALELYWNRPEKEWPRTPEGHLAMHTRPLDLRALLRAAD